MSTLHYLFIILHLSLFNYTLSDNETDVKIEERLIYVQAIWRHGDRAPHHLPYPTDLNNESSWPRGWSQLTNV